MQKFWKKNKKWLTKNQQGLTFVEVIVAIAVLSITILASTGISAAYLRNRISIKKYQANNEELSVALNSMSKDIRMSSLVDPESGNAEYSTITIKNNATGNEVEYEFINSELRRDSAVVIENVTGSFYVKADNPIPRITIRIKKESVLDVTATTVQTTVSMRSGYNED